MTLYRRIARSILTGPSALLLAHTAALAQGAAADCVTLANDAARLACYDRAHHRAAPAQTPMPSPAAAAAPTPAPVPAATTPATAAAARSTLSARWDLDGTEGVMFAPRAYRPVYILPATWTDHVNRRPSSPTPGNSVSSDLELVVPETKYQISLKAKLGHHLLGTPISLWGGYTQSSRWQVYNGAASRPFRETNYEPELMLLWPLQADVMGWKMRAASLSLTHQSNGRSLPLSRSWNRVIGTVALERDGWVAELRPWLRLREKPVDDDNPDIEDHIGRGELVLSRYWGEQALTLQLRHSLRGGTRSRGSAQLDWVFPLKSALHGYMQVFSGYGESLIDYNQAQTKVGVGVTIAGWR
jgi:phospholipase A1/A2